MAQSRSFFDHVRKELECSVCQEQFSEVNEPKKLKCLHTFCKTCLEAWLRQQREGELSCPTCRQITECPNNNIQSLPSNLFYKQMVEIVEAYDGQGQEDSPHCGNCDKKKTLKFYCFDCNSFLCEDCAGAHKKMKVLSSHLVKEIGNFVSSDMQDYARKTNICKKHKDELKFYCHKCNICICLDCAMLEHRDHDFISFDQALDDKKSEIGKKMQEVVENCSRLRNRKESLEKRRERMNNSIDQAANEVHRGAELCIKLIRQHEATMTKELHKQKASLQDSFLAQMTALDKKMEEIDSSLEFGKDVIERNNLPEILNVEEILERRFKELSSLPDEFCVKLSYSEVKYVPSDMSALTANALGKLCYTNTEPSLSIVQNKGLTEGLLGEDSTFTIITKDSQGRTTYSQIDEVNVDIQSLQTGRITKPSITDTKDGCYKVTYKPETAGEFSVSITVAGEAIMGSPFQFRVERPADSVYSPMAKQQKMKEIVTATMKFEAEHEECVRVLPYLEGDQVVVQSYVFSGESGIPKHLKLAAKECFREMEVKLKWSDLYNDAANILKVTPLEYPSGQPKRLNASQVDEISEIISKNLHVLDQHRNVTLVQASFKITESKQTEKPCITFYVLGKGFIPVGESKFPHTLGPYSVDVVDGFWFRTRGLWKPNKAQEQSEVLCFGASIGVQGEETSGTLGAIVEDGGTLYALSCNHVMQLSTKSEIIHPGLNDHLNYLKYHLKEYRELIKVNTVCGSLEHLPESGGLSEKFEGLKSIKENHLNSECAEWEKEEIQKHEEAFERGLKPPRVIGNYSAGVSGNVKWTDGKEYFVDVAIAELTEGEIYSLRKSKTARMIDTTKRISGDCSETTTKAIMNADKLCKSGRTTQYTETSDRLVGPGMEPPAFMKPPFFEKNGSPLFDAGLHNYFCKRCAEQQPSQSEKKEITEIISRCKSCQELTASLCEERWCKNCLCIVNGRTKFADEGDSGAVIFELKDGLPGFGIIFAIHENAYQTCVIASPLQVALEALSKQISEKSNLRLVANFVAPPASSSST